MARDGLVSRTLGSLINGVSQQPTIIRLGSQCESQINCHARPVDGVSRRAPTEYVAELMNSLPAGGVFTHFINRDEGEQYVVVIEDGDIEVYDLSDGNKATTTILGNGAAYIDFDSGTLEARDQFAATTVADFTFITNRKKVLAMEGTPETSRPNEFILHIREVPNIGVVWKVYFKGTTDDTVTSATNNDGAPSGHRDNLYGALILHNFGTEDWEFTKFGNNGIYGKQISGDDQVVSMSNTWGDAGFKVGYKTVQKFADLPILKEIDEPVLLEVIGTDGDEDSNYWVVWDGSDEVWKETVGDALDNDFDADTLPHQLTRTSVSPLEFDFGPATWEDRLKGDIDTAPEPSFIGRTVSDVVFHKNRLCFLADESVILSESAEFFNFWPTTVTTLIESDPIDAAGSNNRVAILDWAVPFDSNLTLFSARGSVQNELVGGETLSQATAEIVERAAFESSSVVRPMVSGRFIFFIVDRGSASGVMEYSMRDNERPDADDITAHVPNYIPANVTHASISDNESLMTLLSSDTPNSLYIYNFFINQDQKIQSSWGTWTFGDGAIIHGIGWLSQVLYIVIERADGIKLEKLDVRKLLDGGLTHRAEYDSLVERTGSYDSGTDTTTWTIGYEPEGGQYELLLGGVDWGIDLGRTLSDADFVTTPGDVTHSGDFSAHSVFIGRRFLSTYEFSEPVIETATSNTQGGASPVTQGRLQIRRWKLLLKNTGNLLAKVILTGSPEEYLYPFSGLVVGASQVGTLVPNATDEHDFDVGGKSTHVRVIIESDTYLPFTLVGAEWEGFYTTRSVRV